MLTSTLAAILLFAVTEPASHRADVVVYGGTSAGVVAAVQAARMGRSVVLVTPHPKLGGLSSSGLGATDIGDKRAIGGLSREFYRRLRRHYEQGSAWTFERQDDFQGRGHRPGEDAAWTFEPKVAAAIFDALVAEAEIEVVRGRLDRTRTPERRAARLISLPLVDGRRIEGHVFIDATYEGDLMAAAGVTYTVGREPERRYGETLNGVRVGRAVHHQFVRPVDPYVVAGDPSSGMLPGIEAGGPRDDASDGAGDHRVQAYCYRLCATDVPENRAAWHKPDGYDPLLYELLLRNFEAGDHRRPWNPVLMPNRKTDANNNFAVSTDFIGQSYDYPDADDAARVEILLRHEHYQKGLMWTLANHPRVPADVREHFQTWGPAKDEFVDNEHWPDRIYVREARRMVAAVVMTEHHCMRREVVSDPIGMGAYNMDSHHVRRYVTADGHVRNEGDVQVRSVPYPISYRSIVPRDTECSNLLVPVCLSASHIAYGSIRMEPVFMLLAQSAATAAVHSIEEEVGVQDLDFERLKRRLLADDQVLEIPAFTVELPGIVIDDRGAEWIGDWTPSRSTPHWVGHDYRHDGDEGKGAKSVRFFAELEPGRYEVRLAYSAHGNRASNVPVTIVHRDGRTKRRIDQRRSPRIDDQFVTLGVFAFDEHATVIVSTTGTDGHVIADAVQWLEK